MIYIINNIRLDIDENLAAVKEAAAKKMGINSVEFLEFRIVKESIDARRKGKIDFIYSVKVKIPEGILKGRLDKNSDIRVLEEPEESTAARGSIPLTDRPVIVGTGPAGMFAGLILAQNGYKPLLIERGAPVEKRNTLVHGFWTGKELDPDTNVQFGEGGAGTFSDGKLTTRIHDRRCERVLEEFFRYGAHEEILYKAKPHIGTDVLKSVVKNMREKILSLGGEVLFHTCLEDILARSGKIAAIRAGGNEIPCQVLILAIGHSARDTYEMLLARGVPFEQKPFSIGVRIEHPQEMIDRAQYKEFAGHPRLGAADYQLVYKKGDRTAYSFCMCPGGIVVAAASEPESIVTNGMSEFARDRENANSALVVSVGPGDFGEVHPLAGVAFQRKWERLAFKAGGGSLAAPVQKVGDFLQHAPSKAMGLVKPSYTGETKPADLRQCLPGYVTDLMEEAVLYFDRKIRGFAMVDAVMTGVETRTSSPVRIPRDDSLQALGMEGLYPCGEGAGYAGGIVSAAVDGIRIAERIMEIYTPYK